MTRMTTAAGEGNYFAFGYCWSRLCCTVGQRSLCGLLSSWPDSTACIQSVSASDRETPTATLAA